MAKKAKKKPAKKAPAFWWFEPETVDQLREQLNAAGPGARLEVRIGAKKAMTLSVVPSGAIAAPATAVVPLNKSHICPPFCP
jgi:hypothetical protein